MDFQGYDLRDNPKKSWKSLGFDDDDDDDGIGGTSSSLKFQCQNCDKKFESRKALFGHMRLHSGSKRKRVNCQECGRKFESLKALTGHLKFHRVSVSGGLRPELVLKGITVKRKRSRRMRYYNSPKFSLSSLNESSGLAEIDPEVEEAAFCLMMLSRCRGVRNCREFYSLWESCDNNSEITSLHQNNENFQTPFLDFDQCFQKKKQRVDKSDSDASASMNGFYEDISECRELDYGIIMTDMEKKAGKSQAPNDMLPKVNDDSGFELNDAEMEERVSSEPMMTLWPMEVEPDQNLTDESVLAGLGSIKSISGQEAVFDACDTEPVDEDSNSMNKLFKCRTCSKTFKSHQSLGGHQTIHRKSHYNNSFPIEKTRNFDKSTTSSEIEYVENSLENGQTNYGTRAYKVYRCLICLKVFASGQALGGHKRSHHISNDKQKQLQVSDITDAIDLDFPVMQNEEANGDTGFNSCRVGSDCQSEALVSLLPI